MINTELDFQIIRECLNLPYEKYAKDSRGYFVRLEEEQDMVLFRPSQNIQDAWIALEKFDGDFIVLRQKGSKAFECEVIQNIRLSRGIGTTPALAICSALMFATRKNKEGNL